MQIEEFLAAKKEMESEIRSAIVAAVAKFRQATSYTPQSVNVFMICRSGLGEPNPYHVVGQVKAEVEL